MTEEKQQTRTVCPDDETLSAYFDGECSLSEDKVLHIRNCPECQKKLQDFTSMTRRFHAAGDSIKTDDISMKILSQTRSMLIHPSVFRQIREKRSLSAAWKIRLLLLLLAVILFIWLFFFRESGAKKTETPLPPPAAHIIRGPAYTEFRAPAALRPYQGYSLACAFSASNNPLESLMPPSFCVLDPQRNFSLLPPAFLPGSLCRTWCAPSFDAKTLQSLIKETANRLKAGTPDFIQRDRMLIVSIEMNTRQTAVFLRQLHAWGLLLLSPAGAILPEQSFFYGQGCEKVCCHFTFLTVPEALALPSTGF